MKIQFRCRFARAQTTSDRLRSTRRCPHRSLCVPYVSRQEVSRGAGGRSTSVTPVGELDARCPLLQRLAISRFLRVDQFRNACDEHPPPSALSRPASSLQRRAGALRCCSALARCELLACEIAAVSAFCASSLERLLAPLARAAVAFVVVVDENCGVEVAAYMTIQSARPAIMRPRRAPKLAYRSRAARGQHDADASLRRPSSSRGWWLACRRRAATPRRSPRDLVHRPPPVPPPVMRSTTRRAHIAGGGGGAARASGGGTGVHRPSPHPGAARHTRESLRVVEAVLRERPRRARMPPGPGRRRAVHDEATLPHVANRLVLHPAHGEYPRAARREPMASVSDRARLSGCAHAPASRPKKSSVPFANTGRRPSASCPAEDTERAAWRCEARERAEIEKDADCHRQLMA